MVAQILATKLYLPPPPAKAVARSRLVKLLSDGLSDGWKISLDRE